MNAGAFVKAQPSPAAACLHNLTLFIRQKMAKTLQYLFTNAPLFSILIKKRER
jgi:hypothetical protein